MSFFFYFSQATPLNDKVGPAILRLANAKKETHWGVIAVGYGVFGFGFAIISETTLSYLMDSYQDVSFHFLSPLILHIHPPTLSAN